MANKMAGLGMSLQEPEPLSEPATLDEVDDIKAYTLTEVSLSDTVFKEISIDFENADMQVLKVERVINPDLWKKYKNERDHILQQRMKFEPDFKLNEKYLYHGTGALKTFICEEGLDSRMSKQGCFGKGIYFSDYPRKCIKYAERATAPDSFILLARVILGTPKVFEHGKKDKSLIREPEKTPPYTGYRFYDSVEGCPVNHKEFVVYESRRALVEYIITFTKQVKPATLLEAAEDSGVNSPLDSDSNTHKSRARVSSAKGKWATDNLDSDFSDNDSDDQQSLDTNEGDESISSDEDRRKEDIAAYRRGDFNSGDEDEAPSGRLAATSIEVLLQQKKREFRRKTGVKNDDVIERYLLRGNLKVSEAIKLFKEKSTGDGQESEEELDQDTNLDLAKAPQPTPDTPEWAYLSEQDKNAVIDGLADDFMKVTGVGSNEKNYVLLLLASVNYNLDVAVVAHYEAM